MEAEPLFSWHEALVDLIGFVALFLSVGAIGFRAFVLRAMTVDGDPGLRTAHDRAASRAAALGFAGSLVSLILAFTRLPALAERRHVEVAALVQHDLSTQLQLVLALAAVVGFAIALGRRSSGFWLAGIGVFAGTLRALFFGQWTRLVNPAHMVAGGLWIGTLFVMVAAGFSAVLSAESPGERRGAAVAAMVHAFSPLALGSAGALAFLGVVTAKLHLTPFSSLWTTPYGYALIAKLCVVGAVLALGAWNWRRQRPRLGTESGALALRRTATSELAVAGIVLVITSILVSLPAPRERKAAPSAAPATSEGHH